MTFWERVWGGRTIGGVAGMDAGKFDVLQEPADDNRAAVGIGEMADIGNAIHIHLGGVFQEFVHQDGPFGGGFDGEPHVMLQFGVGINDLHGAPAEDKGGADQNGVAEFAGGQEGFGLVGGQAVGGLGDAQLVQHGGEQFAVLGDFDALGRGADDVDAVLLERQGEVERGLASELCDGAPAFLALVNVEDVLQGKRFEEELVAGVVIGGDGFGVGIDHQGFKAVLLQGEGGVNAAIIELDALADAVGAAAQNHDLALVAGPGFVVAAIVGGVIVGGVGLEFSGAGVHQTIAGDQAGLLAQGADGVLGLAGEMGDLAVGKTEGFGFGQEVVVHRVAKNFAQVSGGGGGNSRNKQMQEKQMRRTAVRRYVWRVSAESRHLLKLAGQRVGIYLLQSNQERPSVCTQPPGRGHCCRCRSCKTSRIRRRPRRQQ